MIHCAWNTAKIAEKIRELTASNYQLTQNPADSTLFSSYTYNPIEGSKRRLKMGIIAEFERFVRLLLTILEPICSNERSSSSLRHSKTYFRPIMLLTKFNSIAILHVHREVTDKLDLETLLNIFLPRNSKCKSTKRKQYLFNTWNYLFEHFISSHHLPFPLSSTTNHSG